MRKQIYALIFALSVFIPVACDDFLTQLSENDTTVDNFFNTEENVETAVYGMHERFRSELGDFLQAYRDRGILLDNFGYNEWGESTNHNLTLFPADSPEFNWRDEYLVVSSANLVINNIDRAHMPVERRNFYLGQALCVRAYLYFYIIRLWGDAPLVLKYEDLSEKGRTPWREIADQVVEDLKLAVQYLPPADSLKDSGGKALTDKQIPSRGTAYALLAHVYAWIAGYGQEPEYYAKGIAAAEKVMSDPNYSLVDSPEEICTEVIPGNSREGIFEICYDYKRDEIKSSGSYIGGAVEKWPVIKGTTPATKRSFNVLNTTIEQLYTPGDLRLAAYFVDFFEMKQWDESVTQGAAYVQMWRYVEYYEGGSSEGKPKTFIANEILIRLADIILLHAEMNAAIGRNDLAEASLNKIRERAGVADYSASEGDLRRAIQLERDKELLFQTGVRYFDYMRNRTYNLLKGGFKTLTEQDVKDGALFLPVSIDAMNNNPATKQTPYWLGKF